MISEVLSKQRKCPILIFFLNLRNSWIKKLIIHYEKHELSICEKNILILIIVFLKLDRKLNHIIFGTWFNMV